MAAKLKPKVVYWNNMPSPYMVDRWNAIADRGVIDLEVWLSQRREPDRSWTVDEADWRFTYRYMPATQMFGRSFVAPIFPLRHRPDLMISLYAEPRYLAAICFCRLTRIPTMLWVEKTFDSWVTRKKWKESLKRLLFPRVEAILTPGADGEAFAIGYGARANQIYHARHSIDVEYFATRTTCLAQERQEFRSKLGVRGTVFLYVGRLVPEKGLDTLFDAYGLAKSKNPNISLLIVGDGSYLGHLMGRITKSALDDIVIHPFVQQSKLPRLYSASDVFVFPTLGDPYGLVVDEAMASGLPIISSTSAGEIALRVAEDVNGRLVEPNDAEALGDSMIELAASQATRTRMGFASRSMIEDNTPERFAEKLEQAVFKTLAMQ